DPPIPNWIDPVGVLLDRHANTVVESKAAIIADGKSVNYGELKDLVRRYAGGLAAIGLAPESRLLLFGTDSLDYIATWLGAVYAGAVPVVVSDLYKQKDLLYFLIDTAVRVLYIDAEQLPKLIEIAADLPLSLKTILVRGDIPPEI